MKTMKLTAGAAVMLLALVMTMMMTACSGGDDSVVDTPKPPVDRNDVHLRMVAVASRFKAVLEENGL